MLASCYNLTGTRTIEEVKKKGKLYQKDFFGIIIFDRKDRNPSKFAFIVSTKISTSSVQRNRIKRAMSESVRQSRTRMKDGFDVIFLAKKIMLKKMTEEIMKEVEKAVSEVGLMR